MVGADELISMAKNRAHVMRIASAPDFEVPGRCLELFVFRRRRLRIRTVDCAEHYSDRM